MNAAANCKPLSHFFSPSLSDTHIHTFSLSLSLIDFLSLFLFLISLSPRSVSLSQLDFLSLSFFSSSIISLLYFFLSFFLSKILSLSLSPLPLSSLSSTLYLFYLYPSSLWHSFSRSFLFCLSSLLTFLTLFSRMLQRNPFENEKRKCAKTLYEHIISSSTDTHTFALTLNYTHPLSHTRTPNTIRTHIFCVFIKKCFPLRVNKWLLCCVTLTLWWGSHWAWIIRKIISRKKYLCITNLMLLMIRQLRQGFVKSSENE